MLLIHSLCFNWSSTSIQLSSVHKAVIYQCFDNSGKQLNRISFNIFLCREIKFVTQLHKKLIKQTRQTDRQTERQNLNFRVVYCRCFSSLLPLASSHTFLYSSCSLFLLLCLSFHSSDLAFPFWHNFFTVFFYLYISFGVLTIFKRISFFLPIPCSHKLCLNG